MTTQELISVHLGECATPEEEALLSRELAASPTSCRDFVAAARTEGTLQALASGEQSESRLSACLEAAGVLSEPPPSSVRAARGPRIRYLAGTALALVAAALAWNQFRHSTAARRSTDPTRKPPPLATRPASSSPSPTPTPATRPAVAERASRFFLSDVDFDNQSLDTVIERVLAAVAQDNHLQRPEFLGFELAWQPLDVASASSPPKITIHQSSMPLATALEWIAILSDCTVQWHDHGARLIEHLPETAIEAAATRTFALADLPIDPADPSPPADPDPTAEASATALLEAVGLAREITRSARLDAATGTITVELPDAHWERLQKVMALRERAAAPDLTLTARLVEFAEPRETTTEILDAATHRELVDELDGLAGVASLSAAPVQSMSGKPFQIERTTALPNPSANEIPDWSGMRITGQSQLAGEVVAVQATVHLRLPAARPPRPSLATLGQEPIDAATLREYAADLEASIPPGHTVVFAITEKGAPHCLTLHLTADLAGPLSPPAATPAESRDTPATSPETPDAQPPGNR